VDVLSLLEEIRRKEGVGVENLDLDESFSPPVERDPCLDTRWGFGSCRGVTAR